MIKVLVDSGSTKSDWLVLNGSETILQFELAGLNPMTQSKSNLLSQIEMAKNKLQFIHPESITFYGAGCKDIASQVLFTILQELFPSSKIEVYSDLLAAARANCDGNEGIVCIMGTGSHSCLSDGHQIIHEKPGLGYLLGDEGSGNHFGRLLLRSYFYKYLSPELCQDFQNNFPQVTDNYLGQLYSSNKVSAELASFFPFIVQHITDPTIIDIIKECLDAFYRHRINQYQDQNQLPVYFTGSVAFALQNQIETYFAFKGFHRVFFNKKPLLKLAEYHYKYDRN
ncbi:MAG: hypothetical protein IPJ83_09985 [Saprospiraceae bacterium]|nr:hypothetical protein [Candidatus Vicinibacter proximus]HRG33139.1 hypothetical protein [Saprospiraceae bacterium]